MDIERIGDVSIVESVDLSVAQGSVACIIGLPVEKAEKVRAFAVFALVEKGDNRWEKRFAIEGMTPRELELFRKVMTDESLA